MAGFIEGCDRRQKLLTPPVAAPMPAALHDVARNRFTRKRNNANIPTES